MPRKSKKSSQIERNVALCYVRKSWTRDEKDAISPERQRANIEAVCSRNGWIIEWYEDTTGHRSGMHEKNRPGWLALKARMSDPDVVAIVANDLARLHRKGWRIGDLIDFVDQHGITLVIADPQRHIDFSTLQGKLFAQLSAIFDEWYAMDVSQGRKADIAHRKAKGITVGLPPFGTRRHKRTGFLIPRKDGVWLLPNGKWQKGLRDEQPPVDGAVWRGYFECAERILKLYVGQGKRGKIHQKLQDEGWAFRDPDGDPRAIEVEDIRRVISNFAEYGGYVSGEKARDRHPADHRVEDIIVKLNPERAVFPIELLSEVARARHERAFGKHPTHSVNKKASAYPLGGIIFCAHCAAAAEEQKNHKLRTKLSGHIQRYYRHRPGVRCGSEAQSIPRDVLEGQFTQLIKALEVKPESYALMEGLALSLNTTGNDDKDLEQQRTEAIALCRRRIDAAVTLYGEGHIDKDEYFRRRELNEREIASWQNRTTEREALALQLSVCVQAVDNINRLWDVSDDEDKQGLARYLFESIIVDLDRRQIVEFKLKPWADQFLTARVGLWMQEDLQAEGEGKNVQGDENRVVPTGLEPVFSP